MDGADEVSPELDLIKGMGGMEAMAGLGKQVGADLREGKLTLPVILARDRASASDRNRMIEIISDPAFSGSAFEELTGLIDRLGGLSDSKARAEAAVQAAKASLGAFPSSGARDVLNDIADYSLARKH